MMAPESIDEAAAQLRKVGEAGTPVRPVGSGSRVGWGGPDTASVLLSTEKLDQIVEHNPGDFTAVLEAGVPLAAAQESFATAGQWLAIDPGPPGGTIGGLLATGDSGPVRHRYGSMRDLVIGVTLVLSDGTVARSGGRVIKNVAGYDLGKLFTGSYGTLGLIAQVAVRLHPVPIRTASVVGSYTDASALASAALGLARRPIEANCLDAFWQAGEGRLLVRFGGVSAPDQAAAIASTLAGAADVSVVEEDESLWASQRAAQRSPEGAVLAVSGRPAELARVTAAADSIGASLVSRAALGLSWLALPSSEELAAKVAAVRSRLAPRPVTVRDGSRLVSDPWPAVDPGALKVMERVKARFDPARIFRPGAFVGGL
jgi:glycolate oxidase FAD binding subunit